MNLNHNTAGAEIEILPAARLMAADAINQLMAHAEAMGAAQKLGSALAATDMVPKDYKGKPGNAAAAILYGAELGLNPIQSLQQIFIVHGSPAIYARTAVALVKRAGVIVETVESSDQSVTVRGTDRRTGQVEEATWDIARATQAGYTANAKYKTNPQEMLYSKAAMEVARKIAPDVLLGIPYAREELDLEQPTPVQSSRRVGSVSELLRPQPQQEIEPAAVPEPEPASGMLPATRKKWQNRMFALLADADCPDREDQLIVITALAGRTDDERPEHRDQLSDDELRTVVNALNAAVKEGRGGVVVTDLLNAWVQRAADEPVDLMENDQPTLTED